MPKPILQQTTRDSQQAVGNAHTNGSGPSPDSETTEQELARLEEEVKQLDRFIRKWHIGREEQLKIGIGYIRQQGECLLRLRELVGKGNWSTYCNEHLPFKPRMASNYTRFAQWIAEPGNAELDFEDQWMEWRRICGKESDNEESSGIELPSPESKSQEEGTESPTGPIKQGDDGKLLPSLRSRSEEEVSRNPQWVNDFTRKAYLSFDLFLVEGKDNKWEQLLKIVEHRDEIDAKEFERLNRSLEFMVARAMRIHQHMNGYDGSGGFLDRIQEEFRKERS